MTTREHSLSPTDTPTAWTVLRGPTDPDTLTTGVTEIAARHQLRAVPSGPACLLLTPTEAESASPQVTLRWQPYIPQQPDTLSHVLPATHLEILLDHRDQGADAAADLAGWLKTALRRFHPDELVQITATMPLLAQFTPTTTSALAGWAVIFRDHYVENTLGFLLALQRAGIPARWIYALAKGDRTHNRDRVHATLLDLGCTSGLLDNTAINAPDTHALELASAMAQVDAFIDAAHEAGRKVLVIDDGGLLAQGYGRADAPRRIDAALELTVSGLKRITAAGELGIPVLNLARSQLKTRTPRP
ncbi:hypothetical protein ACWDX8_27465 [Streptomyces anthocyanicus]